jgi:hypothetical protein
MTSAIRLSSSTSTVTTTRAFVTRPAPICARRSPILQDSTGDRTLLQKPHLSHNLHGSTMRVQAWPVNWPGRDRTCDLGIKSGVVGMIRGRYDNPPGGLALYARSLLRAFGR